MSIELPEAKILAKQLNNSIRGHEIESYDLMDVERMMKIGFLNKNILDFKALIGEKVESVISRGNTIRIKLSSCMNLLIAPEYGGILRYLSEGGKIPKYHLKLVFTDGSILTTRITSMGLIYALKDENLSNSYMYKRDFLGGVSPDEEDFSFEWFKETIGNENRQLKSLLVGKDAYIIGVSNATFQDVIYRAGIHPKRKASELSNEEIKKLYNAIKYVISKRLEVNGKTEFTDIYGEQGGYIPAMGPHMKDNKCPNCATKIERLSHGGGHVYICTNCQPQTPR
jgi:formamidopyrimidine-DNA glycosylase